MSESTIVDNKMSEDDIFPKYLSKSNIYDLEIFFSNCPIHIH